MLVSRRIALFVGASFFVATVCATTVAQPLLLGPAAGAQSEGSKSPVVPGTPPSSLTDVRAQNAEQLRLAQRKLEANGSADKATAREVAYLRTRDAIYEEIMAKGWSEKRGAFVQSYGSEALDASNLLMPLVFFIAPSDRRMLKTIEAIRRPPAKGGLAADGLVYRYSPGPDVDGLPGHEGTFDMCSFWLVEALTRAGRTDPDRLEDARLLFEQMLGYANHLGLYAEQTGPSGEALGNFPQALTHLALISAAVNLDRVLGE